MADNQSQTTQEEIDMRLAEIHKAVAGSIPAMPQFSSIEDEVAWAEQYIGSANNGCPIDPQERLQCEGCQ